MVRTLLVVVSVLVTQLAAPARAVAYSMVAVNHP